MMKKESKTDDVLPGVRKVSEVTKSRSTVLYGRSGTGKTTLAASWPKPMLYLNIKDNGTDSISDVEDIDVKDVEEYDDLEDVLLWLIRNPEKYKTVVLDTLSQLQEIMVEEAAKAKKKMKGSDGKRPGDFGTMTKQSWGQVASKMKSMIIDFRDLPLEVVFIAQDRIFRGEDEDTTSSEDFEVLAPEVGPRLMPSVASALNAAVSNIGNTFIRIKHEKKEVNGKKKVIEKKQYCLRIGPSALYVTKIRKPKDIVAPDFIVDPTYEDILAVITGEN